jgi:hypothetical protein
MELRDNMLICQDARCAVIGLATLLHIDARPDHVRRAERAMERAWAEHERARI